MGHKIWHAKHKTKSDPGPGSYSRVDRETALSGVRQYHWFYRDDIGFVHRVAHVIGDQMHAFVFLCAPSVSVAVLRVSQSEVGRGPALTCSACAAVDAP